MLRALALFPLLFAGAFVVVTALLGGGESLAGFLLGQRLLVRVLAIGGCLYAASVFSRGEHLRRAWQLLAVSTILVLCRDLLAYVPFLDRWVDASPIGEALRLGLGVVSNLFLLAGVWWLARSWKLASMVLPGGRAALIAVTVVTAGLALALAGPAVLTHARAVAAGEGAAVVMLASSVVDILALTLLSPLLLTALSLRGGILVWPWALITASLASWVLYDAAELWRTTLLGEGPPLTELFRGLAQCFQAAAGVAQGWVVKRAAGDLGSTQ
jgi:hypothetical protein